MQQIVVPANSPNISAGLPKRLLSTGVYAIIDTIVFIFAREPVHRICSATSDPSNFLLRRSRVVNNPVVAVDEYQMQREGLAGHLPPFLS